MQVMCRMTHLSYSPSKVRIKRGYFVGCLVRVYAFQRIGISCRKFSFLTDTLMMIAFSLLNSKHFLHRMKTME